MANDSKTLRPAEINGMQVKVYSQNFTNPMDQEEYLKNLAISSEFELPPVGCLNFTGRI